MQKLIKSFYKSSLITSIILFVIGTLLLFKSNDTIIVLSYIIGGILFILGIIAIINFFRESSMNPFNDLNIVYGLITIIFGSLIISNPTAIATFIPFVVGVGILINSSIKLAYSIELKNNNDDIWKSTLVMATISAICGMLILFNPFKTSVLVFKIIGVFIMIYSLLDIVSSYQIKSCFKVVTNEIMKADDMPIDAEIIEEVDEDKEISKSKEKDTTKKRKTSGKKTSTNEKKKKK